MCFYSVFPLGFECEHLKSSTLLILCLSLKEATFITIYSVCANIEVGHHFSK